MQFTPRPARTIAQPARVHFSTTRQASLITLCSGNKCALDRHLLLYLTAHFCARSSLPRQREAFSFCHYSMASHFFANPHISLRTYVMPLTTLTRTPPVITFVICAVGDPAHSPQANAQPCDIIVYIHRTHQPSLCKIRSRILLQKHLLIARNHWTITLRKRLRHRYSTLASKSYQTPKNLVYTKV